MTLSACCAACIYCRREKYTANGSRKCKNAAKAISMKRDTLYGKITAGTFYPLCAREKEFARSGSRSLVHTASLLGEADSTSVLC